MMIRKLFCGCALFLVSFTAALAQADPEAVYAKLHSATLAGNSDEVMSYLTASTKAELAAKPPAERLAMIRALAQAMPKTYTITEKTLAPDGNSAALHGTGVSEFKGRAESYLSATFRKEGEAWKAASWAWSNRKPLPAAKPAAPVAATPAESDVAPQQVVVTRKMGPLPAAATPAEPELAPVPAAVSKRPSRAHLDARECLKRPTDRAIMACAEKFR